MKPLILGLALLVGASPAWAGDADVCYSRPVVQQNPFTKPVASRILESKNRLGDHTVFVCGHAGAHTLPELAASGWHIDTPTQQQDSPTIPAIEWMVVIQK